MKRFKTKSIKYLATGLLTLVAVASSYSKIIEENAVYRIINNYNSNAMTISSAGTDLMAMKSNEEDTKQWWYVVADESEGVYLRNVSSGVYMKCDNSGNWSAVGADTPDPSTMLLEVLQTNKVNGSNTSFPDNLRVIHLLGNKNNQRYAHNNNSNNVISWNWDAGGSQWLFYKVDLTEQELQEIRDRMDKVGDEIANIDKYQAHLRNLFKDEACTELIDGVDLENNDDYKALPPTLRKMADKVKSGVWEETCGEHDWDSKHAEKYRIQLYEPYSEGSAAASLAGIQAYTNMNNPTGILSAKDQVLYIMVDSDVPEGATLYINGAPDEGMYNSVRNGLQLHKGLNAILCFDDVTHFFVYYTVETVSGGKPARKLENYEPIKIHIEGGTLNGFFNIIGDRLYAKDTADDFKYTSERAKHPMYDMIGENVILHFHLNDTPRKEDPSKTYLGVRSSLNPSLNPNKYKYDPVGIMEDWDAMCLSERMLMGIQKEADIDPDYYESIIGEDYSRTIGETTYYTDPGFDYSDYFNNKMMGISMVGDLYMNATSWRTAFNVSTISYVLTEFYDDGLWGPAHEYGHINQGPINMAGTTEESNNIFSNVATYFSKEYHGSRCDYPSAELQAFYEGKNYIEYGTWNTTRMFWQLWYYYHGTGHNKKFYPRLYQLLRKYPLRKHTVNDSSTGGIHYEKDDMMQFAKMCCVAAGEDLTDFFTAWGFFVPMDHFKIDDYSMFNAVLTPEDIQNTKDEIKSMQLPANTAILFIDDRVGLPGHAAAGDLGGKDDFTGSGSIPDGDFSFTVTGTTVTVTSHGNDGAGFILRDEEGNLIGFSNSHTFTVSQEVADALTNGTANIAAVGSDEDQTQKEVTNVVNDGTVSEKKNMLAQMIEECQKIFEQVDETKTRVGFYLPESCDELRSLCDYASQLIDDENADGDELTSLIKDFHKSYDDFMADTNNRIQIVQGATYRIQSQYPGNGGRSLTSDGAKVTAPYLNGNGSFNQQWFIDNIEDNIYSFRNYDDGMYIGSADSPTAMSEAACGFVLTPISHKTGIFAISPLNDRGQGLHVNGNSNVIIYLNSAEGSQWTITMINDENFVTAREDLRKMIEEAENNLAKAGQVEQSEPYTMPLTENDLYSNASYTATNNGEQFTTWNVLLDNNVNTYWHSDYSNKDSADGEHHYIRIKAPGDDTFRHFTLSYTTRNYDNTSTRFTAIRIDTSEDTNEWTTIYAVSSGLLSGAAKVNTLPELTAPENTKYIRFVVTNGPEWHGNHPIFAISEIGVQNRLDNYSCTPNKTEYPEVTEETMKNVAKALSNAKEAYKSELVTKQQIEDQSSALHSPYSALLDEMQGIPTIVVEISDEKNSGSVYYDLQGRRITNPSPGIYIRRSGNSSVKVIVK